MDLICPLSQIVRDALIGLYFEDDEDIRKQAKDDEENLPQYLRRGALSPYGSVLLLTNLLLTC